MKKLNFLSKRLIEAVIFLALFFAIFGYLAHEMSMNNMLNTIMTTAHDLLLNTVLYIMGITVLTGALGKLLTEFGVVRLIEVILRPLMKPLYNLPGVAALGAVLTFLSDNPAIISLSKEKNFSQYFKKYQIVSLTNFGTAFGGDSLYGRQRLRHRCRYRSYRLVCGQYSKYTHDAILHS